MIFLRNEKKFLMMKSRSGFPRNNLEVKLDERGTVMGDAKPL